MPAKEKITAVIKGVVLVMLIGYLFYGSFFVGLIFMPGVVLIYRREKVHYEARMREKRAKQLKDGMMALSSALGAGYSVENAFAKALGELMGMYAKDEPIVTGFGKIVNRMSVNANAETAFEEFADEMNIEDAIYFSEVFRYVKRCGGDLNAVIKSTSEKIGHKLETKREITTALTGRSMEQKVMNVIPFVMILYIKLTAAEFIEPLYGNVTGVIAMTVCLVIYAAAVKWSEKIIDIEV